MGPRMALNKGSRTAVAAAVAMLMLSACGAGMKQVAGMMAGQAGNQGIDLNRLSREKIEAFGTPILRATIPSRGLDLLMSPRDTRDNVVTWESAEGITFAFRDGVLIESRGLGADLMSASAPGAGRIASGGTYTRSYWFVADEDRNQRRDYACTPESQGSEAVALYGYEYQTRHIAEACLRDVGKIRNEFWFDGAKIRKSRQWVSPDIGYVEFSRIVD